MLVDKKTKTLIIENVINHMLEHPNDNIDYVLSNEIKILYDIKDCPFVKNLAKKLYPRIKMEILPKLPLKKQIKEVGIVIITIVFASLLYPIIYAPPVIQIFIIVLAITIFLVVRTWKKLS